MQHFCCVVVDHLTKLSRPACHNNTVLYLIFRLFILGQCSFLKNLNDYFKFCVERYCNGHVQVATGMATKKECKSKKGKMVPNEDDLL